MKSMNIEIKGKNVYYNAYKTNQLSNNIYIKKFLMFAFHINYRFLNGKTENYIYVPLGFLIY